MEKEYYLDSDIKKMILFPTFIVIGLREIINIVLLLSDNKIDTRAYLLSLLLFVGCIINILIAYTEKLVVSSDGVLLEQAGLSLFVKWEDMDRIGFHRFMGVSYEGIFAPREKVIFKGFWGYRKEISINLFRYGDDWRSSELGQQIRQYAPRLFKP